VTEVVDRGGEYYRVADPSWDDPLNGSHSMRHGARWNRPGSFPVTYLNADMGTARANARRFLTEQLRGQPFGAEDVDPSELPVLVAVDIPIRWHLDVVTPEGALGNGLPATYPTGDDGEVVGWEVCRPIGQRAWDDGLPGIACRPAVAGAPVDGEELAWFDRHDVELRADAARRFGEWYGPFDW
jgi:hypothetical protein